MYKVTRVLVGVLLLCSATDCLAAATKINGVVYAEKTGGGKQQASVNQASPAQSIRLKKIFLFPSIDDLSGALSPRLDEKLNELFSRNTRFELVRDPQVIRALSPDESAYYKAAQSEEVHHEAARLTGADTTVLLRTHNVGANTKMNLELRDSSGKILFSEEGTIPGSSSMEIRWGLIEKLYESILARLPFEGAVTGRTANTITIDLGLGAIRQGEEIELARIVALKRHPLLGTLIGADYVRTGRAKVTSVDRVLSFAEILEEVSGEKVSPEQKVLKGRSNVIHRGEPEGEVSVATEPTEQKAIHRKSVKTSAERDPLEDRLKGDFDKFKPRFGQLGASLYYGSLSHSQSVAGALTDYAGTGLGGEFSGELWVTKNWIFSLGYGAQSATLSGNSASAGDVSWREFLVAAGFRIFPSTLAEGVDLTGSFGYQSMSFDILSNATLKLGAKKYGGLVLKADGNVHFLEKQKIDIGFALQPFASVTESGHSLGATSGGTVIGVHLGWNRQLAEEFWLRLGARFDVANGGYENSSNSISDKRFAIGPGIYYLF